MSRFALALTALTPMLVVGCTCPEGEEACEPPTYGLPPAPGDDDVTDPCDVVVTVEAPTAEQVQVAGEWNDWTPEDLRHQGGGTWSADLGDVAPGTHAYKFLFDGGWEGDPPPDVPSKWLDGVENRALRVRDCSVPWLDALDATVDGDTVTATLRFTPSVDGPGLDPDTLFVSVGGRTLTDGVSATVDGASITVTASGLPLGKHTVRASVEDADGVSASGDVFVPLWVEEERWIWEDGLIYFVFTDRFRNGDIDAGGGAAPVDGVSTIANYQGGDFLGILDAMDEGYFEALGADVLWLTPVYENPDDAYLALDGQNQFSGFHGYWPVDPLGIESKLGDVNASAPDRLREVIDEAHSRGIRVLFDLVLNHVHEDHVYVQEHPEWFGAPCVCGTPGCDWDAQARTCWFTDYLPDLDYRNHAIVERVLDDTLTLVREWDVDGVRVDAAKHMDHVIMRTLSHRLAEHEVGDATPIYTIGETFTGGDGHGQIMEYVAPTELDGQFDFPLYWAIRDAFAGDGSFQGLEGAVAASRDAYGDAWGLMSPFLGNHDILRFVTQAAGNGQGSWGGTEDLLAQGGEQVTQWDLIDRQSMAFAFTLTQPGLPLIYYGDEIGLAGDGDPDNRRLMNFDPYLSANQEELRERVRLIGQTRAGSRALRRGERIQLWVDDTLLVYARVAEDDVAVVALNKGGTRTVTVPIGAVEALAGRTLVDARGDRSVSVSGGSFELTLGPWDYGIFVP